MSMDKPFRVEVMVDAPRDEVWRALTVPEQIRHWFGWEYDGLDDEIKLIFVEHAKLFPPGRIEMPQDGLIELEDHGDRTLIRVTKPGDLDADEWKDVYGDIEEGWITFFNQLRHRIARHPEATRRTIFRHRPRRRCRRCRASPGTRAATSAAPTPTASSSSSSPSPRAKHRWSSPPTTSTTRRSPRPSSAGRPGGSPSAANGVGGAADARPSAARLAGPWGRVAQWESARFTRERSQVRNPPRPSLGRPAFAGLSSFWAVCVSCIGTS